MEKNKGWAQFSAQYVKISFKKTTAALLPHAGMVLKDNIFQAKIFPIAWTSGSKPDSLCMKKKWSDIRIYIESWAVANDLAGCSRAWEVNNWKTRDRVLEKKHINGSTGGHNVWWSLCHMTTSTRKHGRSTKLVERMTQPHNVSWLLSLAGTMTSWMQLETWKHKDYAWVQYYGILFSKTDPAATTAKCPTCRQQRPMMSP